MHKIPVYDVISHCWGHHSLVSLIRRILPEFSKESYIPRRVVGKFHNENQWNDSNNTIRIVRQLAFSCRFSNRCRANFSSYFPGKRKKKKDRSKEKLWLNLFSEELSGKRFRAGSKWVKDHVPFEVRNLELNRTGISELELEFRSWELVNRGILALNIYSELKLINSIFF